MLVHFPQFWIGPLKFGARYISSYSVTFTIGVLAIAVIALWEAKKRKISRKQVLMLLTYCFAFGLVFSRLFYVIFFHKHTGLLNDVLFFFNLSRSGMASFGAFFGVIIGALVFYRHNKSNIWKILDVCSIGLMLGLAIGRIGCFSAGCCYGKEVSSSLPWAVYYRNAVRHPAQLYDMLNALIVFAVVQRLKLKRMFDGALFLITLMMYSFLRIIVEFFRVGPHIFWFSYNQIFYFVLLAACFSIFMHRRKIS